MRNRTLQLAFIDIIMAGLSLALAFLLRFEFVIPANFLVIFYDWILWFAGIQIVVFYFAGLYARIWRYTSLFDLYAILASVLVSSGSASLFVFFTMGSEGYPRSVLILYFMIIK